MANKVINNNEILKKQSQQVFDTFSVLLKKHQVEINTYATELDTLKTAISKQASVYSNTGTNYKKQTVLNTIYTTQKQAQTIQQGVEEFYKKGLQYYYNLRTEFTGEKITDTVYIQLKDKSGGGRWVRAQNIPFETLMAAADPFFILTKEQKDQEQDFYHLKAQLSVSYKNLLNELDKIGYDYKNTEDVTVEMEKGLEIQEKYNYKHKKLSKQDKVNIGNISEAIEKMKQKPNTYTELTIQNINRVKKNWLSGLLGGDVGSVQVKGLSTNKNFQIVTLNNITSKFKRMAKKLNQMTNGQITIKRLTEFLRLFYQDFYHHTDDAIDKQVLKDINDIVKAATKKRK